MLRGKTQRYFTEWSNAEEPWSWRPVETNIFRMVPFTWIRCLFFLGSMTLYTTDVVRSGLGINSLISFGQHKAEMDNFISFGPYAYPIQTIYRNLSGSEEDREAEQEQEQDRYYGVAADNAGGDDVEVHAARVWPYKFDTLSIGPRALAIDLDVQAYPKCLLAANPPCPKETLPLNTVFAMLDALMTAVQDRFLVDAPYASFAVEHQWIDTFEQTLYGKVHFLPNIRYFTIYSHRRRANVQQKPLELLAICPFADPSRDRPLFCNSVPWTASSALPGRNASEARELKVDDDIALRFARFQAEHPELAIEMLVLTSQNLQWMQNTGGLYYNWNAQELVVLTRGRRCDPLGRNCHTILVDDYRYERILITTNVDEMFKIVASIRGIAQGYVWLRVAMLVIGIVSSTWHETRMEVARVNLVKLLFMCFVNLLKVPSHVVVYGTTIPVVLYASAHLIDSYMYHLIVQDGLTTMLGQDALLQVKNDAKYVTLKMRNIWFIAVLCIALVVYNTNLRQVEEWRHCMGVVGFRGTMMGTLSCTTLLFPVRFPSLRRVDIRQLIRHDVNWRVDAIWTAMRPEFNPATTGPFLETRCLFLAFVVFVFVLASAKLLSLLTRHPLPKLMDQSTIVPYSAGTLWPTIGLTGYWRTAIDQERSRRSSTVAPESCHGPSLFDDQNGQLVVLRTPTHVRALQIERRSDEMWALIRLMNIVMMTNPWVYVRLRFFGVHLYLYRLKDRSDPDLGYLLPDRLDRLYERNQLKHGDRFELVQVVNSRSLSWHELIMCG